MSRISGMRLRYLPPTIRELEEEIGFSATMRLVESFGGITLHVPLGETSVGKAVLGNLAAKIGDEAAELIARRYGGTRLYIPNCKQGLIRERDARMREEKERLEKEGVPGREIITTLALRHHLSDRYVWRILRYRGDPPKQNENQAKLPGLMEA